MSSMMRLIVKFLIFLFGFLLCCFNFCSGKVFNRCELAQELKYRQNIPIEQVAVWVCIAQYQSGFNTSAVGYQSDGSGYHGLYQISDVYWCSPPNIGRVCNRACTFFEDDDITDDLACMKLIFDEHQRISGDGYNAWTVYQPNCRGRSDEYINGCFDNYISNEPNYIEPNSIVSYTPPFKDYSYKTTSNVESGKIYDRCELARELKYKHNLPLEQIATWVCIAKHESNFNTSAIGRLNSDGSGDHGLFQISDIYWCSPPGKGWVCGLTCSQLEDNDITDDVNCMKKIYQEHQKLSGDGFTAWTVYNLHCQGRSESYISGCFDTDNENTINNLVSNSLVTVPQQVFPQKTSYGHSKIYDRCELANELRNVHFIPQEQIATWVCIAYHESNFNTSAIGRLNADGSEDHGLFQISDIYWCSPPGKGWACGLSCSQLEDNDITDDVICMRKIYEEHQRISGDGFNAWTVYNRDCKGRSESYTAGCFESYVDNNSVYKYTQSTNPAVVTSQPSYTPTSNSVYANPTSTIKIYDRCELANELRNVHYIPFDQISTWVCIAYHESSFNTSAIGRLNGDGSEDHGLFQISDIYWCSPPGKGWACGLSCSQLENNDITDDVICMRKIYDEHQRISGDGFNAWKVYPLYCKGRSDSYTQGCFDSNVDNSNPKFVPVPAITAPQPTYAPFPLLPPKIYDRCELAHELKNVHNIPFDQLATWVCIAQHESNFNTSAIGRLNADGSGDHGLFQISDIYWCSPPGNGYACGLTCAQLEDNDITDDVICMKKIHEEHQRLSGDGFNAWTVYNRDCKGRADQYIKDCFEQPPLTQVPTTYLTTKKPSKKTSPTVKYNYNSYFSTTQKPNYYQSTTTTPYQSPYNYNQFTSSTLKSTYQAPTTTPYNYNYNYYTTTQSPAYQYPTTQNPTSFSSYFTTSNKNTPYQTVPTFKPTHSFQIFTQTQPYQSQKTNSYQIFTTANKSTQNYNTFYSNPSYQYTTTTKAPTTTKSSFFNNYYQTQTTPKQYNTNTFQTSGNTATNYQSNSITQYNTQTQRPYYTYPTTTKFNTNYQSTQSPIYTQYYTQTQRPPAAQLTNTYPTTAKSNVGFYYQNTIPTISPYSSQNTQTQTPPRSTAVQQPFYTNTQYTFPTKISLSSNYNTYNSQSITSNQSPSTQFQYNGQSYSTVKPFSIDYIKQITTPKSPYYPAYYQSPSTKVEVMKKLTTVIKTTQTPTSLKMISTSVPTSTKLTSKITPKTTKQIYSQTSTTTNFFKTTKPTSPIKTTQPTTKSTTRPTTTTRFTTKPTTTTRFTTKPTTTTRFTTRPTTTTRFTTRPTSTTRFTTRPTITTRYTTKPTTTTRYTTKPTTTTRFTTRSTTTRPTTKTTKYTTTKPTIRTTSKPFLTTQKKNLPPTTTTKPTTKYSYNSIPSIFIEKVTTQKPTTKVIRSIITTTTTTKKPITTTTKLSNTITKSKPTSKTKSESHFDHWFNKFKHSE